MFTRSIDTTLDTIRTGVIWLRRALLVLVDLLDTIEVLIDAGTRPSRSFSFALL